MGNNHKNHNWVKSTSKIYIIQNKFQHPKRVCNICTIKIAQKANGPGFRAWGHEMNMDTSPVETGLLPFIRMKKKVKTS